MRTRPTRPPGQSSIVINEPQLEPATVIQNDKIGAIIKSNSQAPLFGAIPPEIRDRIWGYVVGAGEIIRLDLQIFWDKKKGLLNSMYLKLKQRHEVSYQGCGCCHIRVRDEKGNLVKPSDNHQNIDLNFLLTCRQLYVEATRVMYEQVTFSFGYDRMFRSSNAISSLHAFAMSRNQLQKRLLRNLHFDMSYRGWNTVSKQARKVILLGELLTGLRTLHLNLISCNDKFHKTQWLPGLTRLRALDLERAAITIIDSESKKEFENVDALRQLLLDPKGAEIERQEADEHEAYEEELRQETERRKAEKKLEYIERAKEKRKRQPEIDAELAEERRKQPKRSRKAPERL